MKEIRFEWDGNKERLNIQKHGVTFSEAVSVFYDENALIILDPDASHDEDRYILLGYSDKARLLIVCHCYREAERCIRIISARKATKNEMKHYAKGEYCYEG